jgi:hypothetical protein
MPNQRRKPTSPDVAVALDSHEKICAIRYENIEKRLDSGSQRFARIEGMILGVYVLIIGSQVITQVF